MEVARRRSILAALFLPSFDAPQPPGVLKWLPGPCSFTLHLFCDPHVETGAQVEHPVRMLKRRLQPVCGVPRFRQRLLTKDGTILREDAELTGPTELQLVVLSFYPASMEQVAELVSAAASNDVLNLDRLLQEPQDPEPLQVPSPLCVASGHGHVEVVRLLVEAQADKNRTDQDGATPLHMATRSAHKNVARLLLEAAADASPPNRHGITPLHEACRLGFSGLVGLLIEAHADTDKQDMQGQTPVFCAAQNRDERVLERILHLLLEAAAETDQATRFDRCTPLQITCGQGFLKIARLLLEARADATKADRHGLSPLFIAADKGHHKVVRLLLEAKADQDQSTDRGASPLFAATSRDQLQSISLLLEAQADMEKADARGLTPVFVASLNGHAGAVQMLLEAHADPSKATGANGATPLSVAVHRGNVAIVRLLLRAGVDVDQANHKGETPVSIALQRGHLEVHRLLLEKDT